MAMAAIFPTAPCSRNLPRHLARRRRFAAMRTAADHAQTSLRKENSMQNISLSHGLRTATHLFVVGAITVLVAGCVQDDTPSAERLRRAQLQNLTSETALNAQIMSDRAREQRCARDPSRREC
jgi:hypothetical protein